MDGFISTVKFTETRAYRAVLEKLSEHHLVVILGRPGDGKTTLGLHALYDLQNKEKCIVLMPHPPHLDFLPYLKEGEKVSIFLDDLFGIYSISGYSIPKYSQFQIRSFLSKGNLLVITIRKDIFLQCETNLSKELFRKDVIVDLTDPLFELLEKEKRSMLETVPNITEDSVKDILSHRRFSKEQVGFPQCVAIIKGSHHFDLSSIFETPLKFVAQELLQLYENSKNKFLVLLLAFANDGQLNQDGEQLRNPCHYLPSDIDMPSVQAQQLRKAANSLVNTYMNFEREKCRYVINHETVMEGIALALWEYLGFQKYVISYCPERFLTRISSKHTEPFFIPTQFLTHLFNRLHILLKSRIEASYVTIASIELWDDPAAATKFVYYLKATGKHQKNDLQTYEGASLLVYTAMKGRVNLTRLLLQSCGADVEQLHMALTKASESGHLEVVRILLPLCTNCIDLELIFHAIKGGSTDVFETVTIQAGFIDYESKRESLQCTFFGGNFRIEVNIIEEIVLSGNLALLLHATEINQVSLPKLIKKNHRLVEFAAYCGSIPLMQYLLDNGGQKCPHLLWWAATAGSLEMFTFLLEKGCRFNTQKHASCTRDMDEIGENVNELHAACLSGNSAVVMHIFNAKPELFQMKDSDGDTPALLSPFSGSLEIVKYMDTYGNIKAVNDSGGNILHYAAQEGHADIVHYIINKYPELVKIKDEDGDTPFLCSGFSGSVELTECFIAQDCDIHDEDSNGCTILHNACKKGKLTLVKHLVEKYPSLLTMKDNQRVSPLHYAGLSGSVQLTEYLVACHCDVLDTNNMGKTIVHYACEEGKLTLVKHLVENYPALLTMRDNRGLQPLHTASFSGSVELTEYLITCNCDVLDTDSDSRTILHNACNIGELELVKHLVERYPALLTMRDNAGMTPLHHAGWSGSVELTEYLIRCHCDVLDTSSKGKTTLHNACNKGNFEVVKYLVERYPALLTMRDNEGKTPLHHAGWSGSVELTEYLITCHCDVFDTSSKGKTILHNACNKGNFELVKHLVERYPALLTIRDNRGKTPLHHAGFSGSVELTEYLITCHCDILGTDSGGRTILHNACNIGELELVKHLVERYPALLTIRDNEGKTPLHHAGWSGSVELTEYLTTCHCDFLATDSGGRTILHNACNKGEFELVKHLVESYPALLTMRDNEGKTPLHHAGWSGSVELTEYLITCHCDFLATDSGGRTILHNACNKGEFELVKHLVESYTALLTMRDNEGMTPFHYAGWSGSVELTEYLITCHCDALDTASNGRAVLHIACQEGKLELVKHLVENYPALLTMRDKEEMTPLHHAGWSGSVELTEYLISRHCDVLDTASNSRTVLHIACQEGKLELVKHLVENYPALLTMRDNVGKTPLHHAGWSGSVELTEYLISRHCDVLDAASNSRTVLHIACQEGKLELVKHLVENYPSLLTIRDNVGKTPLHHAGWSGSVELTEYLISRHCDVLDAASNSRTVLHIACQEGKLELVKHLVENYPALLTMRDKEGMTPLHHAGLSGSVELTEYLISRQCDVLCTDSDGWTILHFACEKGKLTLIKHLVENYPALLALEDNEGATPLHIAGLSGSVELTEYLISRQCDVLGSDSDGWTILHFACEKGKLTLVKHLVENYPALLTLEDNEGATPLHMAGLSGSVELIEYLISRQCDVLGTDSDGWTILHFACEKGKLTLVKHLVENYPALLTLEDNEGATPLHMAGYSGSVELIEYLITCHCNVLAMDNDGNTILHSACQEGERTLAKHLVENCPALLTMRNKAGLTPHTGLDVQSQ